MRKEIKTAMQCNKSRQCWGEGKGPDSRIIGLFEIEKTRLYSSVSTTTKTLQHFGGDRIAEISPQLEVAQVQARVADTWIPNLTKPRVLVA